MKIQILIGSLFIFGGIHMSHEERIIDIECKKYSKIPHDPDIGANAHIVKVLFKRPNAVMEIKGLLISNEHVITIYRSDFNIQTASIQFNGDNTTYGISSASLHVFRKIDDLQYAVMLMTLEAPLQLDSSHRPACIFTGELYEENTGMQLLAGGRGTRSSSSLKPVNILPYEHCLLAMGGKYSTTLMCTQARDRSYQRSTGIIGSPIFVKKQNEDASENYYAYGLVAFPLKDDVPYTTVGTSMSLHLDWLEENVWGDKYMCGRRHAKKPEEQNPNSIDDRSTYHGEFPWHAAIFEVHNDDWTYLCGGTLLNENFVITAAHCLFTDRIVKQANTIRVSLGDNNFEDTSIYSQERHIINIIIPETYNADMKYDDIAILQLGTPVGYTDYVQPICIPSPDIIFPNSNAILTGRGQNENDPDKMTVLLKGSFPIVDQQKCQRDEGVDLSLVINGNNFCAGDRDTPSVCSGDSGGGLVAEVDGQSYLRGIVSIGIEPKENTCTNNYVIFTNVTNLYDWIQINMNLKE